MQRKTKGLQNRISLLIHKTLSFFESNVTVRTELYWILAAGTVQLVAKSEFR